MPESIFLRYVYRLHCTMTFIFYFSLDAHGNAKALKRISGSQSIGSNAILYAKKVNTVADQSHLYSFLEMENAISNRIQRTLIYFALVFYMYIYRFLYRKD